MNGEREAGLRTDLEAGPVYLLGELIDGDVAGRAHKHLAVALLGEVVDDGGGRDRLARARRPLDQAQVPLQHRLHRVHLRVVQLGQPGHTEALRQAYLHRHAMPISNRTNKLA